MAGFLDLAILGLGMCLAAAVTISATRDTYDDATANARARKKKRKKKKTGSEEKPMTTGARWLRSRYGGIISRRVRLTDYRYDSHLERGYKANARCRHMEKSRFAVRRWSERARFPTSLRQHFLPRVSPTYRGKLLALSSSKGAMI